MRFQVLYGWLVIALVAVFAVGMSFRRYQRPLADEYTPVNPDALAAEVEKHREEMSAGRSES